MTNEELIKREARARLLYCLIPGSLVGSSKRNWADEGWPEVKPDPLTNYCYDQCGGRGWKWADPLLGGFRGNLPFVCCCTLEVL